MWHVIDGNWCGKEAEHLYSNVVAPALKKQCPSKTKFTILEDNDPTGNQCRLGLRAKKANN